MTTIDEEAICPVLQRFVTRLNERWPIEDRQKLEVFTPRLIGTPSTKTVENKRAALAIEALSQRFLPFFLDKTTNTDRWSLRTTLAVIAAAVASNAINAPVAVEAVVYVMTIPTSDGEVRNKLVRETLRLLDQMIEIRE